MRAVRTSAAKPNEESRRSRGDEPLIPSIVPITVLRLARELGHPVKPLFEGLSSDICRPGIGRRASWNEVSILFERLDALDARAIDAFAAHYVHRLPVVSFIVSYVFTPDGLYRLMFFAWQRLWPMLNFNAMRVDNGWRLKACVDPELRGCEPFFRLVTEVLRRGPGLIGHAPSDVDAVIRSPREAEWLVRTGLGQATPDDAELDADSLFSRAWEEMLGAKGSASPTIPAGWGLTPAEARVVEVLRTGKDVATIARSLHLSRETVRTHLKRAMGKAGVCRQAELIASLYGHERE